MYHRYTKNSPSTGEPPTPPLTQQVSSEPLLKALESDQARSSLTSDTGKDSRPQSLTQDSGYEASPSSIIDGNSSSELRFFGSEEITGPIAGDTNPDMMADEQDVFEDFSASTVLMIDEEDFVMVSPPSSFRPGLSRHPSYQSDEIPVVASASPELSRTTEVQISLSSAANVYAAMPLDTATAAVPSSDDDVFEDCASSVLMLEPEEPECCDSPCSLGLDSSATILDVENCDTDNGSSDQSSPQRPSSLPIRIPNGSPERSSGGGERPVDLIPPRVQLPTLAPTILPRSHPRSWPMFGLAALWRSTFAGVERTRPVDSRPAQLQGRRSRRRLIDSDASSIDSSDENDEAGSYPEVFAEENPPRVAPLQPLPDLLLHSSPAVGRRNRSVSVNLPPDLEVLQSIGSTLRRLSEDFESRRALNGGFTRRRQTISEIDRKHFRPS